MSWGSDPGSGWVSDRVEVMAHEVLPNDAIEVPWKGTSSVTARIDLALDLSVLHGALNPTLTPAPALSPRTLPFAALTVRIEILVGRRGSRIRELDYGWIRLCTLHSGPTLLLVPKAVIAAKGSSTPLAIANTGIAFGPRFRTYLMVPEVHVHGDDEEQGFGQGPYHAWCHMPRPRARRGRNRPIPAPYSSL